MTLLFVVLASALTAAALACVALPILRSGSDEYAAKLNQIDPAENAPAQRSRIACTALLAVALLLPAGAIGLYLTLGEPRAFDPAAVATTPADEHGPDMEQAIAGLVAKLAQTPEDLQGWLLLGRAYKTTQHFSEAREALKHAIDLAPDDPDAMVEYAEALALAGKSRRIEGEARALVEKAVTADPTHQRGLWLLGVAEYQDGHHATAIARWEQLKALLPADSGVAASVQAQIDEAKTKAGDAATADSTSAPVEPPRLQVEVMLDPKLAAHVAPDYTLFVFARAANGPPMPLAIQRLTAAALPAKVVLSDDMGMLPNLKLSQFPQVVVGARVSKSGNASAASGDVQALSAPVDVHRREPIMLMLDQVVP